MNDNKPRRPYRSDLRKLHSEQTANALLDAASSLVTAGDREVSYAEIARVAGVSVPTVYRHFPTREDLFRAFVARDQARYRSADGPLDMNAQIRTFFARMDDPKDPMGTARLHVMWEFSRVATVPLRRQMLEAWLDREAPGLGEPHHTQVVDLGVVLLSSATGEAFRGYLDRTGAETADRVLFALDALIAHARTLARHKPEVP
jgi:AcrR family transcriptional regulator